MFPNDNIESYTLLDRATTVINFSAFLRKMVKYGESRSRVLCREGDKWNRRVLLKSEFLPSDNFIRGIMAAEY